MRSSSEDVTRNLTEMVRRLRNTANLNNELSALLLRLYEQYPDDIGVFAPLVLNYLRMQQGDSFFIGPNVPHAYISGDCVECMALSDNVVRAGLTPKLRDVETLCDMLNYESGKPAFIETQAIDETGQTLLYRPPKAHCAEFEVEFIQVHSSDSSISLRALPAASLVLVLSATETLTAHASFSSDSVIHDTIQHDLTLTQGSVFFLAANASVDVTASIDGDYKLYRAHVNLG